MNPGQSRTAPLFDRTFVGRSAILDARDAVSEAQAGFTTLSRTRHAMNERTLAKL